MIHFYRNNCIQSVSASFMALTMTPRFVRTPFDCVTSSMNWMFMPLISSTSNSAQEEKSTAALCAD